MVDVVHYPGLDSFPQKELADRQHKDVSLSSQLRARATRAVCFPSAHGLRRTHAAYLIR